MIEEKAIALKMPSRGVLSAMAFATHPKTLEPVTISE